MKVCYFHDDDIGSYHYGHGHPMKPLRTQMTHDLLEAYGIASKVERMVPDLPSMNDLTRFHADDYISFLQTVTCANTEDNADRLRRYNVGEDCPVFDGLWDYCLSYSGGTIGAAHHLMRGDCQQAVNWSGGMHHGKKQEASGFCYVNDCVLGCLEFLKYCHRVLYIDIDIHHGDGVEEAFYTSPRVMTLSFHKFGDYFPGTGHLKDVGCGEGRGYSVNVPLADGLEDQDFSFLFEKVGGMVLERYQPQAIVLQSGADSLSGDRLGCFNLSLNGHDFAARYLKGKGIPLLLLGGGGYTLRNVAKCWANETATLLGAELDPQIPSSSSFHSYYAPDYLLGVRNSNMKNLNCKSSLDSIVAEIGETIRENVRPVGVHISSTMEDGSVGHSPPVKFMKKEDCDVDPDVRNVPADENDPKEQHYTMQARSRNVG